MASQDKVIKKEVYEFYTNHGKAKCVEFVRDVHNAIEKPHIKSYEKSVGKLIGDVKTLKKSSSRRSMAKKCESFLIFVLIFFQNVKIKNVLLKLLIVIHLI